MASAVWRDTEKVSALWRNEAGRGVFLRKICALVKIRRMMIQWECVTLCH